MNNFAAYGVARKSRLSTGDNSVLFPPAANDRVGVAEEPGDYESKPLNNAGFTEELKRIELWALYRSADTQIGRLLRLTNVLDGPSAVDRPAEELARYATEVRQAASALEEILHNIVDPLLQQDTS